MTNIQLNNDKEVTAYVNKEFKSFYLKEELENKWSIVFFYPADFTFVCPTELGDLADYANELTELGVSIYSVSTDTHFTHKAWHDSSDTINKISFPMIGDPSGYVSKLFNVLNDNGLASRATFVIAPDGTTKIVEITDDGIGRSASELVRKIKAALYVEKHPGEVCPAKWTPGSETLTPTLDLVGKI